jgi:hypothetical protein
MVAVRATAPVNEPPRVTVTVAVPEPPAATFTLVGATATLSVSVLTSLGEQAVERRTVVTSANPAAQMTLDLTDILTSRHK